MNFYCFNKKELYSLTKKEFGGDLADLKTKKSLQESTSFQAKNFDKNYDIFLSHSSNDARIIWGIKKELENSGHSVYVDWIDDSQFERSKVDKKTAQILRQRMESCKTLIYVFTNNAKTSKWMPWELGYFDGAKGKVAILPVLESTSDNYEGVEFLGLYPIVKYNLAYLGLGIFESDIKVDDLNKWIIKTK
jgi:hypothetical protein